MKRIISIIKKHEEVSFGIGLVIAMLLVSTFVFGYIHHLKTKARNQAIARAQNMDGRVYTIDNVAWNWLGDTKLILKDETGRPTGWVMIYMTHPLTDKINPLFLAFTNPHGKIPLPMKIRAHFRPAAWTHKDVNDTHENYTGSFIEFEILEAKAS